MMGREMQRRYDHRPRSSGDSDYDGNSHWMKSEDSKWMRRGRTVWVNLFYGYNLIYNPNLI